MPLDPELSTLLTTVVSKIKGLNDKVVALEQNFTSMHDKVVSLEQNFTALSDLQIDALSQWREETDKALSILNDRVLHLAENQAMPLVAPKPTTTSTPPEQPEAKPKRVRTRKTIPTASLSLNIDLPLKMTFLAHSLGLTSIDDRIKTVKPIDGTMAGIELDGKAYSRPEFSKVMDIFSRAKPTNRDTLLDLTEQVTQNDNIDVLLPLAAASLYAHAHDINLEPEE